MDKSGLLFLDSDIFVLLAGVNLLQPLITAAGFEPASTRRLQPLPYMLQRSRLARTYSPAMLERAKAWCPQIPPLLARPSGQVLGLLVATEGIDPGEAALFAATAEDPQSVIATADTRACAALSVTPGLSDVRKRLEGRVIPLVSALWMLLDRMTYPDLARALTAARQYSKTIGVLLPQGELTCEGSFRTALEAYSRHLEQRLAGLMYPTNRPRRGSR